MEIIEHDEAYTEKGVFSHTKVILKRGDQYSELVPRAKASIYLRLIRFLSPRQKSGPNPAFIPRSNQQYQCAKLGADTRASTALKVFTDLVSSLDVSAGIFIFCLIDDYSLCRSILI